MEESEVEGSGDLPVGGTALPTSASSLPNSADTSGEHNESSSNVEIPKEDATDVPDLIHCPKCNTKLDPREHRFCFGCGKCVQEIVSSMLKRGENYSSGAGPPANTSSETQPRKVVVTADNVENTKQQVVEIAEGVDDSTMEKLEQLRAQENNDRITSTEQVHGQEENLGVPDNSSISETAVAGVGDEVTASQESSGTAADVAKEQESEGNLEMSGNSLESVITAENVKSSSDFNDEVIEATRVDVTSSEQTMTNDNFGKGFQAGEKNTKESEQLRFRNSPENVENSTQGKNQSKEEQSDENNQLDHQSNDKKSAVTIEHGENIEKEIKKDGEEKEKDEMVRSAPSSPSEGPSGEKLIKDLSASVDISSNIAGNVGNAAEGERESQNGKKSAENNQSKAGVETSATTHTDSSSGHGTGGKATLKEIAAGIDPLTSKTSATTHTDSSSGHGTGGKDPLTSKDVSLDPDQKMMGSDSSGYYYMKNNSDLDKTGHRGKKKKKEQKENETTGSKNPPKDSKVQKGVTVVFHAILSEKFKRAKDTQIFIVGETPLFHGWKKGSVEIMTEKTLDSGGVLLRGQMTVPMQFVDYKVPYKYCLQTNGKLDYELLIEFESAWGAIANRCLVIPKAFSKEDMTWHKYDSFVYPNPGKLGFFYYGLQTKDRIAFFKEFFPKWSGFHVIRSDCDLPPTKAVEQLECLLEGVSSVWTQKNSIHKNEIPAYDLPLSEVCRDFLIPKINDNLNVLSRDVSDQKAIVAAVVSSVVIVHVLIYRGVKLGDELVGKLFMCLKLHPDQSVCDVLVEEMKQFDHRTMSTVTQSLCQFYNLKKNYKSLVKYWMHALPLLHFVRGDSKPFEDLDVVRSIDYSKQRWWGLSSINVRDFWRHTTARDAAEILPELSGLFKMDRLLSRSFLLLSPVDMYHDLLCTGYFSLFELCATMRKILPEKFRSSYTDEFQIYLANFFREVNKKLAQMSNEELTEEIISENDLLKNFVMLLDFLRPNLAFCHIAVLCRLVEAIITLIVLQCRGIDHLNDGEKDDNEISDRIISAKDIPEKLLKNFRQAIETVHRFIKNKSPTLSFCKDVEVNLVFQAWNELLYVAAPNSFNDLWHNRFKAQLNERMREVSAIRAIEIFCQSDEQKCHPEVTKCLSDAAFKAVDEIVKPGQREQKRVFGYLTDMSSQKCVGLLSRMLQKAWPLRDGQKEVADDVLLENLLTWPTWPGFLQFFGSRSSSKIIFDEESQIIMTTAESRIEHLVQSVQNGSVTVATLEILEKHYSQFISLGEILQDQRKNEKRSAGDHKSIRLSFGDRIQEINEFRNQKEKLDYFFSICDSFKSIDENLFALKERLKEDISTRSICDLCTRSSSDIFVVHFNLDQNIYDMVSNIYVIQNSRIFNELWKRYGSKLDCEASVTMAAILQFIWAPLCEKLMTINETFVNGKMEIRKVEKYLQMFKSNFPDIQKEFELLLSFFGGEKSSVRDKKVQLRARIQQVKNYQKLFNAGRAAKSILDLRSAMELTGDFSEVERIAEVIEGGFSTKAIGSVSHKLLEAGRFLENITEKRDACLKTFSKCLDLVKWLKGNIGGQQELKVFVDLAMISAGESDMEIDRISFMHTSCLGFGSLIFVLKSEDGFQDLMNLCEPVWQAVDANPNLPEQFENTNRELSWLKQIKESHGSVALTTLMQVEAINASGVYHIADFEEIKKCRRNKNNNASEGDGVCLESVICLVVPGDDLNKREEKVYSLEEVKDVQSKLMLIAGKADNGKEEVDQFVEVFEGVLRVGCLYVQLCEVGEINYLTWKIKLQCSKSGSGRSKLLKQINDTCSEMEKHLNTWKRQVDGNRKDCYSLNHFTMKQILKLRKELAFASTGQIPVDELPLQTFTLLESVCKDVNPIILTDILQSVIPDSCPCITDQCLSEDKNYFGKEEQEPLTVPADAIANSVAEYLPRIPKRKNSLESFNSARESLQGMGYGEDAIIASLRACGRGAEEEELVTWVIENEDDEETRDRLYLEALGDPELAEFLQEIMGMDFAQIQCVHEEKEFIESDFVERKYVSSPLESFVKNKVDTYLTLPVLVVVLEKLARSEPVRLRRKIPRNLKEGEPNLLLVPKGEIFACILSLFMGAECLPTDEEVIVCDDKTTAEEIELLWRRAVVDKSGLLFCLANADLLDYDVSQQAVRVLERITQGESNYRLVVICSIENEDKSNMVASLDEFRRQFPQIMSVSNVQNYLHRLLVAEPERRMIGDVQWQPAAVIDKDGLCVRVIQSSRAGVGKSLVVKRLTKQLEELPNNKRLRRDLVSSFCQTVPVHGVSADSDKVTRALSAHALKPDIPVSRIFHLDISQSVSKGLDAFLFKLLILSAIKDSSGNVWRRKTTDMYVIEVTTDTTFTALTSDETLSNQNYDKSTRKVKATTKYSFLKFLPRIVCLTPRETLSNLEHGQKGDTEFDIQKFHSVEYQRIFQYLKLFNEGQNLNDFTFQCQLQNDVEVPCEALKIIIKYCGIRDPSWAELHHFVNFLNSQLRDGEASIFLNTALVGDLLQGFRTFVVRFLIQMSRDFATRSLSDRNFTADEDAMADDEEDDLAPFQIRRRWEKSPHPYIFFNQDRTTMTFLGFLLSANGDLLNPVNNEILEPRLMNATLRGQLKVQGVDFDKNYEAWDRWTRITNLCRVMGVENMYDPDSTYELTTDNVEKILAIHMRFRCGIPVIIMGETGCGKTRLIRFMCELQAGPSGPKNMLLMKVHGGTTYQDIERKVKEAEELASKNSTRDIDTVLFFDEANTTDAIDLIKEVMVDQRVNGRPIYAAFCRLHFIAACNPYRKHTNDMIHKLESAGLGYHVSAQETEDKLGSIPLRQLVYRVHPLPESMRPLVWDFGHLTDHTEELYTRQIVRRFLSVGTTTVNISNLGPSTSQQVNISNLGPSTSQLVNISNSGPSTSQQTNVTDTVDRIHGNEAQASCIAKVLSASQKYMRGQNNECSFVSLRDVERAMKVITWFYVNSDLISNIVVEPDNNRESESSEEDSDDEEKEREVAEMQQPLNKIVRALVLGIGVSYYARLNDRSTYCRFIAKHFTGPCPLPGGAERMIREISRCQQAFLNNITLGQNIARNTALSENVFMMAICTELRIPLFVIGKPGSSKSLAKDVISTHMKGNASQSELFKNLKEIHMQSYQCSPLSTPDGIVSTFRQCSKLQKDKDLKKFVSVVVLDEIGLAEDSPLMPLKTLHPLLEDGTATEEDSSAGKPSEHLRVGFIGLSNWALDPAKMNRGIMLSRGVPTIDELIDSAKGICSSDAHIKNRITPTISRLAEGYKDLYDRQKKSKTLKKAKKEEFFGLRDFYSLVKMVYGFAAQSDDKQINSVELEQAIRRNFSGLDDLNPMKIFNRYLPLLKYCLKNPSPESDAVCLINQSLHRTTAEGESRYLLVLTENYAALTILQQQFLEGKNHDPVVIFGSSFPKDQHYTQICRNINRIKVCMETGRMVILLNLESLYESLYDALNQYYLYLAGQKYVDLGLGSHRVKCRVADNFKLIVVAEKNDVYMRFPIPLINRLEKHFLVMSTSLKHDQERLVKELEEWVDSFSNAKLELSQESSFEAGDCFVGYHSDTAAAVILKVSKHLTTKEEILKESKSTLLQCASPDAIARLSSTVLKHQADELWDEYFKNQKHKSLLDYLDHALRKTKYDDRGSLVQITTHSRLLSQSNARAIAKQAGFEGSRSRCVSLQEFHTEQQFTKSIQDFFLQLGGFEGLLLIQCDNGEANFNLIACCRYLVVDTRLRSLEEASEPVEPVHIVFLIQLPKIAGGCQKFVGFQGGKWRSVHIDELSESSEQLPRIDQLVNRSISELFKPGNNAVSKEEDDDGMEVDRDEMEAIEEKSRSDDCSSIAPFNPALILRNCLQAAAARVFDESANVNRATRRIEILLSLLPEDPYETDFSRVLVGRVQQLLRQRDEWCWQDKQLWLQHEALFRGRLQETGTFRKALWQKLSSIVSPLLSEVIAYCDCNENLDLVESGNDWKSRFWLAMLNEEQVTALKYESFISPVSRAFRERARVVGRGHGHSFKSRFPFSWLIKDTVEQLFVKVEGNASNINVLCPLRGVLASSQLGGLLNTLFEDNDVKESALMAYLHDFLHMSYKPTVDHEMELVFDAVLSVARVLQQSSASNEESPLDIALFHFTYSLIQARLSCFSDLVRAFPSLVKKVFDQKLNSSEMILDVVTLEYCLQELEPRRGELENNEARLVWCNRVQNVQPAMQVMTRLFTEKIQGTHAGSQISSIGETSMRIMNHCRLCFVRLSVVRLFLEHTCPPGETTHLNDSQNGFTFWKALGESPDFSSVETMDVVERFLKDCSDRVSQRNLKYGADNCAICTKSLEEPVEMPCQHVCCITCVRSCLVDHNYCPICRHDVGENFNIVISDRCRQAVAAVNNFRIRCKSFFMELVAVYCFGEESRQIPNPGLVKKFIGYVIKENKRTEDFTPFDGQGVDSTPVLRSFILQQLLAHKARSTEVHQHLEDYLRRASGLIEQRDHMIEVCVMCVQCMEDAETTKLLKCKEAGDNTQIVMATRMLESSLQVLSVELRTSPNIINASSLQTVATTRAALEVLSTYLGDNYSTHAKRSEKFQFFLGTARRLCAMANRSPIRLFLLKQVVRKYGIDTMKERCEQSELQWILPVQNQQEQRIPDSFIVHHENYHTIREALANAILRCDIDELDQILQGVVASPSVRDVHILLALFREITTSYARSNGQDRISAIASQKINKFIVETIHISTGLKELAAKIVANTNYRDVTLMCVTPQQSRNERRLAEVLVHLRIVLECCPQNGLLQPLRNLAGHPATMQNAFLPTMPHDYGADAMQAGIEGTWYECQNGHRYVITECGRPNQNYTCSCGAAIGGSNHSLVSGSRAASRVDQTRNGHIIGAAETQPQTFTSERNLTPLACGILRLLTHGAMLLGADQDLQIVGMLVKPPVTNIVQFLVAHLQHNIRWLAQCTGNNEDEAMQIIHLVLTAIVNRLTDQQVDTQIDPLLSSKESRHAWENAFVSTYLNPVLSTLSQQLQDTLERMVGDKRLGSDPLMRQLYELDTPNYDTANIDAMCPALWRYRTRVSVEHLKMKFQEYLGGHAGSSGCEILKEFLKREHLLRALQYLPDIVKFQRQLSEKFHRRLDRDEAETFTLGQFLKEAPHMRKQVNALVNSFRMAWKLIRSSLSQNGRLSIPPDLRDLEVTDKIPISMFLPSNFGYGRCALGLTSFLVTLHNEFIGRCKSLLEDESSSPEVSLANVTKAHLVAYDTEKDLIPMILAYCDYSLKIGEGTIVDYNWMGLERQLVDRFIRGRSKLTSLVELFVFSKDICDGEVFAALKQKVPQIELSRPVQDQINNELIQLTDICDVLKSLQIAIGFLASAGGRPDMLIDEYLQTALKMSSKDGLKSPKAQQGCEIRHIISLWRLLSLERARLLTARKQDPFDNISETVKKQLSKNQTFQLSRSLQKINVDLFVRELLEVILLYLKHVPEEQLHWPLSDYLNAKLDENGRSVVEDLDLFIPEDILLEHAVETWKIACQKSEDYHDRMPS